MTTLKDQLPQVSDWRGLERESNQECVLMDSKQLKGGIIHLFEFISKTGHPYDAKGLHVVVVEENYAYIDNYYKQLF